MCACVEDARRHSAHHRICTGTQSIASQLPSCNGDKMSGAKDALYPMDFLEQLNNEGSYLAPTFYSAIGVVATLVIVIIILSVGFCCLSRYVRKRNRYKSTDSTFKISISAAYSDRSGDKPYRFTYYLRLLKCWVPVYVYMTSNFVCSCLQGCSGVVCFD